MPYISEPSNGYFTESLFTDLEAIHGEGYVDILEPEGSAVNGP
jgi:hypothetical protein